jgi:hypothetical protein
MNIYLNEDVCRDLEITNNVIKKLGQGAFGAVFVSFFYFLLSVFLLLFLFIVHFFFFLLSYFLSTLFVHLSANTQCIWLKVLMDFNML